MTAFSKYRGLILGASLACLQPEVQAEVFQMPPPGSDLIGEIRYTKARYEDTLIDIARQFSVGQDEIVMANPQVDRWLPGRDAQVLLPRRFILPDAPRVGIVLNIPEMRMYYFPGANAKSPASQVISYPVSIGRMDWRTPLGATRVVAKQKDPAWRPPATIKREHAQEGDILPDVVPPGPLNPLGRYAMKLGVPGYLIHGTGIDKAFGIGMRVTHGCIRMYPEDIERLFPQVAVGVPVYLVNQTIKLGWMGEDLYIEVSEPLDEDRTGPQELLAKAYSLIEKKTANRPVAIDREALTAAVNNPTGIPVAISHSGNFAAEQPPEPAYEAMPAHQETPRPPPPVYDQAPVRETPTQAEPVDPSLLF
jgi:L,D-transpeptidase ErfK/SrfK